MYGSRESRFPYRSTKGFIRRYSQSVESIFIFLSHMSTWHDYRCVRILWWIVGEGHCILIVRWCRLSYKLVLWKSLFTLIFRVYKCEFLGLMVRIHESCPKVIAEISACVFFFIFLVAFARICRNFFFLSLLLTKS